jgi:hypothetical protein
MAFTVINFASAGQRDRMLEVTFDGLAAGPAKSSRTGGHRTRLLAETHRGGSGLGRPDATEVPSSSSGTERLMVSQR